RKNSAPKIVTTGRDSLPVFDDSYDPAEQRRVKQALLDLNKSVGNELWPLLVKHFGDKRYALTFEGDFRAQNETVGILCRKMAWNDLLLAYIQYAPSVDKSEGLESPNYRYSEWTPDLNADWYREREGKQLYELQVELCEWAMTKAPALKELSDEQ